MSNLPVKPSGGIFGHRMLVSFQSQAYRYFFIGSIGQIVAMVIQMMVTPLLIYRLTGSSALLGINALVGALPSIVIGLFGGAIADRLPKKFILIACFGLTALITLAIAIFLDTGHLSREVEGSWWILMVANFFQGCVMGFMMPALMALVPETVKREHLMNAIALNNLEMSVIGLISPSIAGIMIDRLGFESIFYTVTGAYLFAIIFFWLIPINKQATYQRGQILSNITNGLKYIRSNRTIFLLLIFIMAMVILSMPFQNLLPLFTDGIFNVGATGLGLLMSLGGAGGLAGSLAIALLPNRKRGLLLLFSGLLSAAGIILFAFSPAWGFSLTIMVLVGLAGSLRGVLSNTLLQTYTDAPYMGRVMSLTHVQFGFMAVVTFLAGLLAERIMVQWVVGGMGIILVIITLVAWLGSKRIYRLN
ncbi:MAG TPA: MFS transporter [Dehalococcoidales bacterium]|nr:MFS transporter [Dehalococcoidales bacterium]